MAESGSVRVIDQSRLPFQFTTIDLPGSAIRYVRLTLTTADLGDWWSVADVRAYVSVMASEPR